MTCILLADFVGMLLQKLDQPLAYEAAILSVIKF